MMKTTFKKSLIILITLANITIVALIFVFISGYNGITSSNMNNENINNIININDSSRAIAETQFNTQSVKLNNIKKYITLMNMSYNEILDYIYNSSCDDDISVYELISTNYTGHVASKHNDEYIELDYSSYDYQDLWQIFTNEEMNSYTEYIGSTPLFTDDYNALKSFGLYTYIPISENDTVSYYTLICLNNLNTLSDNLNFSDDYEGMSTTVIDSAGDYVVTNPNYKGQNFYDYLYTYNDLSLDKKNDITNEIITNSNGTLYYKNSRLDDCIYIYSLLSKEQWYCVTCVPLESFHYSTINSSYTILIAVGMSVLLLFNVIWLTILNHKLKSSIIKEVIANNAKTDFLSRLSHDIRTPLNGIIGTTLLALDEDNSEKTTDYLHLIDSSGNFLLGLVNDILDMTKVESGNMVLNPEPYLYTDFLNYIQAVVKPLCDKKNIQFIIRENLDKTTLCFDKLRLNQIIFNLLSNAVKFTPSHGKVELRVNLQKKSDFDCDVDIEVSDTGIGMSKEFQSCMFEAFSQEKKLIDYNNPGTGLGLAIVKNLVNLMGGTISVKSIENEGTTFYLHFETKLATEDEINNVINKELDYSLLIGKRILLCEDNPVNSLIATELLEKKKMIIDHAENGELAYKMFINSTIDYYDIILMDIMMPIYTGLEATKMIRASHRSDSKSIPILAMTANAYSQDIVKCKAAGMNSHLSKPIEPEKLYATLVQYV